MCSDQDEGQSVFGGGSEADVCTETPYTPAQDTGGVCEPDAPQKLPHDPSAPGIMDLFTTLLGGDPRRRY